VPGKKHTVADRLSHHSQEKEETEDEEDIDN